MNRFKVIKEIKSIKAILPAIAVLITGKPRYIPKIEWSSNSWTHNIFRCWEMLFGREVGVRAEASASRTPDGVVTYRAHTFEGGCLIVEHLVREFFKAHKLKIVRVHIPQLAFAGFSPVPTKQPYVFAIAYDSSGSNGGVGLGTDNQTFSFSTSGSNRVLALMSTASGIGSPGAWVLKYNSVTASLAAVWNSNAPFINVSTLIAPATGSNTVLTTYNGTSGSQSGITVAVLMTGANQTTAVGATQTASAGASSISLSISSTVAASLLIDCLGESNTNTLTKGASQTQNIQTNYAGSANISLGSSRQAAPTVTSYNMDWTVSPAQVMKLVAVEVLPSTGGGANANFLLFMPM